jgi:hypothetical protein
LKLTAIEGDILQIILKRLTPKIKPNCKEISAKNLKPRTPKSPKREQKKKKKKKYDFLGIHGAKYEVGGPFENLNELLYMHTEKQEK